MGVSLGKGLYLTAYALSCPNMDTVIRPFTMHTLLDDMNLLTSKRDILMFNTDCYGN